MEIIIREKNKYNRRTGWFWNQARNDTLTDVAFLNETTLLTANREDAKMYILEFSLNPTSMKILDTIDLIYDGKPRFIDLFTVHKNKVYFVSLNNTICTVNIVNNKLIKDTIRYLPNGCEFHGITVDPTNDDILYLSGAMEDRKLTIYSLSQNKILKREYLPGAMRAQRIKQCKFLQGKYLVLSSTLMGVQEHKKDYKYPCHLGIFNISDWTCVDELCLGYAQIDSLCVYNDVIYLTYQDDKQGKILTFKVENEKLKREKEYIVKGFPHGVDVNYDMVAAACLQSSSVCVMKI